MKAYVFQAALLCEDCANTAMLQHSAFADNEDSDKYPQGPYSDGGGEADCPQHCDHCHIFLENPLTPDGVAYIREAYRHNLMPIWTKFYKEHLDNIVQFA